MHAITAGGAVCGLLALDAIGGRDWKTALLWMAAAVLIDGVDGPLARAVGVKRVLPAIDGNLLDNLVDYLNYAIVPAFLLHQAALLPPGFELPGAVAICVASAFQFVHRDAKQEEQGFRGFPSYWNLVAFYLLVLDLAPWLALALVAALCVLTFVPIYFVHPVRTRELRGLTLALTATWTVAVATMLVRFPEPQVGLAGLSLVYVVYYAAASVALAARVRRRSQGRVTT